MDIMKRCEKRNILYREWATSSPKAVLLLVHGLGGHSNNWEYFAEFFQKNGITSYAIELKGFGATEDLKGHISSLNVYVRDVRRLHHIIKREQRGKRIFIAGESMGGLIGFIAAIQKPELFRGLVCISPGFASLLKFSFMDYLKMITSWFYNPRKQFNMPFDSKLCTRDPECRKLIDSDELEHRLATPKLLQSILVGQLYSRFLKHKVRMNTLFLLAGNDEFVDARASRKIFNGMKFENKEIIEYPGMSHSLTAELGRGKVFADTLKWVLKKI